MQTERDRRLLRRLGVGEDRIAVDGNTKFDQPTPEPGKEQTLAQILGWGPDTTSVAAGSTHAGEEEIVLEAFLRLRQKHPKASLLIAPRHPERAAAVGALIARNGLRWVRRSKLDSTGGEPAENDEWQTANRVVVLDTIGELALAYRLARASFVGGSLISSVGGHNPLEVTAEGRPVFFGPHMRNCRDIASLLCEEKVGRVVHNASELAFGWQRALKDDKWLSDMEARARKVMLRHRGASSRAAQRALTLLSERSARARSLKMETITDTQLSMLDASASFRADSQFPAASPVARGKQYLLEVVHNRRNGLLPKILRAGLSAAASLYGAGLAANLALYDIRLLHRKRVSCPVIGVGNITMGGTGKTLITLALCDWLLRQGKVPAILSRGYGGDTSVPRLVFDGERLRLGPKQAGDEPFLLAASLPGVRVLVGKDRRRSAEMALALGVDIMVLDDGFQYWKMEKDFELVLVDALNPFGNGRLLPCGLLREPLTSLRRADAIWITHSDLVEPERLAALEETLGNLVPGVPVAQTVHQPVALCEFTSGDRIGLWTLEGKRVLALSGLGNPFSFELLLRRLGTTVVPARFPDHHLFDEEEIASAIEKSEDISMIITTAKDAVRLPKEIKTGLPLRILEVRAAKHGQPDGEGTDGLFQRTFSWLCPND